MGENQIDFLDADSYSLNKDGISIKDIVLRRFIACTNEGSKEMTRGGVITRIVDGKPLEIAVPDQIEIFIRNVKMLKIILEPEIVKNPKIMEKKIAAFNKDISQLNAWVHEQIQDIDKQLNPPRTTNRSHRDAEIIKQHRGIHLNIKNEYDQKLCDIYHNLLESLSFLLSHLNYFDSMGIND